MSWHSILSMNPKDIRKKLNTLGNCDECGSLQYKEDLISSNKLNLCPMCYVKVEDEEL